MQYPINYSSEEITEVMKIGGAPLKKICNSIATSLLENVSFKRRVIYQITNKGGTTDEANEVLNGALATFFMKLTFEEIRLLPEDLLPYYAGKACMKIWNDKQEKPDQFPGFFRVNIKLSKTSIELQSELDENVAKTRPIIENIVNKIKKSPDFFDELHSVICSRGGTIQETRDIVEKGLNLFQKNLENNQYKLTANHLIPYYILGICKNDWLNELKKKKSKKVQMLPIAPEDSSSAEFSEDMSLEIDSIENAETYWKAPPPTPYDLITQKEAYWELLYAIDQQAGDCPQYLKLTALRYSIDGLAEHFAVAYNTAKNQLSICRKKLRAYLKGITSSK